MLQQPPVTTVFPVFGRFGIVNVILIHQEKTLNVYQTKSLAGYEIEKVVGNTQELSSIFQDKFKNLEGYSFRVSVFIQSPRIVIRHKELLSVDFEVAKIVAQKVETGVEITKFFNSYDPERMEKSVEALRTGTVDFILNTSFASYHDNTRRLINTHDENGFCTLIPIPPRLTFLNFLLTPYDTFSWFFMLLSMIVCAIFWKLLRSTDDGSSSSLYFMFCVVANFVGQTISFRADRRMQVTLLQLCILMTFILGNAYQSLIIASMSSSRDGVRFKTINEVFASNIKFKVDPTFYNRLLNSGEFSQILGRMEPASGVPDFDQMAKNNIAIIAQCDMIEYLLDSQVTVVVDEFYYLLPEKMMKFSDRFRMATYSPFYEFFQTNFDYVFESGIRQFWKSKFEMVKIRKNIRSVNYLENEEYLLTLGDVYGIFYILLVCLALGFFTLMLEIFWHGCLRQVDFKMIFENLLKEKKSNRRMIRRIQVQPIEV